CQREGVWSCSSVASRLIGKAILRAHREKPFLDWT
ncbi:MAG: hypothetical protein ACI9JD_003193, partial [Rhodococcus sp. (in: high G+C Gram-positive bacteria)]